jgi:CubicO group peptidase (beta-lactamase class C family)
MRLATDRTNLRYPKPEKAKKEKEGKDKTDFAAIGRHTWDRIRASALNGASCCVTIDGKTAYQGAFGSANIEKGEKLKKDTLYRLASMTKPVTAVAVMMMVERGKIDLDAPVAAILPEFEGQKLLSGEAPSRGITARDLLTHSSGLCQDETAEGIVDVFKSLVPDNVTLENMVRGYAALPLAFEPRSRTGYSALAGFDVLARMVEVAANMKFEDFARLAIFEPLKMNNTTWYPTDAQWEKAVTPYAAENGTLTAVDMGRNNFGAFPASYTSGAAGLLGTLSDYSRFAQMLLNEGELDGARILEAETVRQMKTVQLFKETTQNVGDTETWGLGMRVITAVTEAQPVTVGSFGWSGAYGTHFWIDPEKKLTAVYMSNMTTAAGSGADTAREFERDVYDALK